MAEEPQPSNVKAGSVAADADGENPAVKNAASKDDAKAAAALDKLDARTVGGDDDEEDGTASSSKTAANSAALAGAMSNLKVGGDNKKTSGSAAQSAAAAAAEAKKKVKVDPKDVALVVEYCELRKDKATELLKNHEGDVRKALTAWVSGKA